MYYCFIFGIFVTFSFRYSIIVPLPGKGKHCHELVFSCLIKVERFYFNVVEFVMRLVVSNVILVLEKV